MFNAFVKTVRNGKIISELKTSSSNIRPNADFLFPDDNIIAELKCLEKNPTEASDWPPRLAKAFRSTGHSLSDLLGYVLRGEPLPDKVKEKLTHWMADAIRTVVKSGNRQIRSSKKELHRENAKGALLIANDNNYGFPPHDMMRVICNAATRLIDNHVDALVYFTPNISHHLRESDVAWNIWYPAYQNPDDVGISEFINDLGRKWFDFVSISAGEVYIDRKEIPDISLGHQVISSMRPVRPLGRGARIHRKNG
jgi:hypothetical protein